MLPRELRAVLQQPLLVLAYFVLVELTGLLVDLVLPQDCDLVIHRLEVYLVHWRLFVPTVVN